MIKLELSAKMLCFVIDAVDERISAYHREIADPTISEDQLSDAGNDRMVLQSARDYLKQREQQWRDVLSDEPGMR